MARKPKRRARRAKESGPPVTPRALGQSRQAAHMEERPPFGDGYVEWLDEQKREDLMQRLSEGTRSGYETGWRQWITYRKAQRESPWLEGRLPCVCETGCEGAWRMWILLAVVGRAFLPSRERELSQNSWRIAVRAAPQSSGYLMNAGDAQPMHIS